MTGTPFPDTPPQSTPASPTSPTSTEPLTRDYVVDIINDADDVNEGGSVCEKEQEMNEKIHATDVASVKQSFSRRILGYPQQFLTSNIQPFLLRRHRSEDGRPRLIQRIDDHPRGYPKLAAFMNSDENFLVCRKYSFLRSRVLLYRQDELSKLEETLCALDQEDAETDDVSRLALMSRKTDEARNEDPQYSRKTLIHKIDDKLKQYDDCVRNIQLYASMRSPCSRNWNSFAAWMKNIKPLTPEEREFMNHKDDFVALADDAECGWLDGVVEDTLSGLLPKKLRDVLLKSSEQRLKSDDEYVQLISKRRTDIVVRLILTLTTVGLLVGPSAVLFVVPGHRTLKIVLIMLFTLLFSAAVSVFTKAKRHEMLAATATYAAVLVVFLGNFPL